MSGRSGLESSEQLEKSQQLPPASWVDGLLAMIDRLPGPPWLAYIVLTLALALLGHVFRWVDGTLPLGAFNLQRLAEPPLLIYPLALIHYLNRTARAAVLTFKPALKVPDSQITQLQYEISNIPRREAWIGTGIGVLLSIGAPASSPELWGISAETSVVTLAFIYFYAAISSVFYTVLVIHTIRQLRLVITIHDMATNINLWHRLPVYAFSSLTSRIGIGIVVMLYYYVLVFYVLDLFGTVAFSWFDALALAIFLLLATASFVLPLSGMQKKLAREKGRLVSEAERRFERTLNRLHKVTDSDSLEGVDGLNKVLTSLIIERDALARISTWPWKPETLRGFLSSIALPILLWLVTNTLGQVLKLR